jgi:hypothetical protein
VEKAELENIGEFFNLARLLPFFDDYRTITSVPQRETTGLAAPITAKTLT